MYFLPLHLADNPGAKLPQVYVYSVLFLSKSVLRPSSPSVLYEVHHVLISIVASSIDWNLVHFK